MGKISFAKKNSVKRQFVIHHIGSILVWMDKSSYWFNIELFLLQNFYLHTVKKSDHFFEKTYEVVRLIPYGRVTSYGAIAKYLGAARSARMVGWAMNNSSKQVGDVPAHRVVNRKGLLTGKHHFDGTNLMQQLLESEGIVVINNQVQDLEKVFWNPMDEL